MVSRLIETRGPVKLTQENHPENAVEPEVKQPTVSLGAMVGVGALCALLGMTLGSAGLSTSFLDKTNGQELLSMIPLMGTAVCILGGWVGAFFWMCRDEANGHKD